MTISLRQVILAATTAALAMATSLVGETTAVYAAPPTAQVSPGYEARLAEARRSAQLATRRPWIVPIRRRRHHHHRAME